MAAALVALAALIVSLGLALTTRHKSRNPGSGGSWPARTGHSRRVEDSQQCPEPDREAG